MERLGIPLLLPLAATAAAALIIVGIGNLLLTVSHAFGEDKAVALALTIAAAILLTCTLVARAGSRQNTVSH
ncbi:MAG TPA: hypothetical protein VFB73_05940 [Chloroflexota bacterium]|nr:hypothetical protein [Chloroflexota bacterium]